jgi:transcription antitermination protein NusB
MGEATGEAHAEPVAPGERRRARTVALQALYEIDATNHDPAVVLQRRIEDDETAPGPAAYAERLVSGVLAHQQAIDELIVNAAPAWPLEQMSRVDKSILRQAIFEMLYMPGVPPKVAINEAVELAKAYGGSDGHKYVNGVLDKLAAETRAAEVGARRIAT